MNMYCELPEGAVILRTRAMRAPIDPSGRVSRGWLITQLGLAGRMLAQRLSGKRTATIAIDALRFTERVMVGDVVSCYGSLETLSDTSVALKLEAWAQTFEPADLETQPRVRVAEGQFTYLAIDNSEMEREVFGHAVQRRKAHDPKRSDHRSIAQRAGHD